MSSYQELFPPTEHGTAHPLASLPLAEQLHPAHTFRSRRTTTDGAPYRKLSLAWSLIEYALATPECTGDSEYFGYAQQELSEIVDRPGATLRQSPVVGARLLLASLEAFRLRARYGATALSMCGLPERPALIDDMQGKVGDVLQDFLVTDHHSPKHYSGRLSEILAMYLLLLNRHLPFPSSNREEANIYSYDNHDVSLLEPDGRIPVSVKHVGLPTDNPLVLTLKVGTIAQWAAWATGVSPPSERDPLKATESLATTLQKHHNRAELEDQGIAFIRAAMRGVERKLVTFRSAGYSNHNAEIPDLPLSRS